MAEAFMKAYGIVMQLPSGDNLFQEFMTEWQAQATQSYLMVPREIVKENVRPDQYMRHKNRADIKIVLVFPDLSVAVCGDDGGVATNVQSMMSDWWATGKRIFEKGLREHHPELS